MTISIKAAAKAAELDVQRSMLRTHLSQLARATRVSITCEQFDTSFNVELGPSTNAFDHLFEMINEQIEHLEDQIRDLGVDPKDDTQVKNGADQETAVNGHVLDQRPDF